MHTREGQSLKQAFGARMSENELLSRHTAFRIGGPADLFVRAETRDELLEFATRAREFEIPVVVLGNGSNILVADEGVRGLVIDNHADAFEVRKEGDSLILLAESGALLPGLGNRLARQGWSGLEWAIGVPSTVGAAVVGNAGAHGSCIADSLMRAEVLTKEGETKWWDTYVLEYAYRSSRLKRLGSEDIVLQAEFRLRPDKVENCIGRMNQYTEHRRQTQPTDPSIGSMFKNPPGDYSGRLIEAAGLKGMQVGQIEVSRVHANFFVNHGGGTARQVRELIDEVRNRVKEEAGIELELEIQLVGDWH